MGKVEEVKQSIENIDDTEIYKESLTKIENNNPTFKEKKVNSNINYLENKSSLINCLRNERIIVRHVPKANGMVTNPKHILYGGMADNAVRYFVVPRLSSGMYVNVLTDEEKAYLEYIMGLEENALSVYKKKDNFWDDSNEIGISKVRLVKQDNYFNLSDPEDYIRYKILLANKDFIAPSLQYYQDKPKATYQFVIIKQNEELSSAKNTLNIKLRCYKEYGKIENDKDTLRLIIETLDGRPTSPDIKLEFLQTKIDNFIVADSKLFYKIITDELLSTKVLIKKAKEAGIISNRDGKYYLKSNNMPLCNDGESPVLSTAAKYLSLPKNQELKFSLEAQISK